ncbi:MAG: 50S ribosomal protein L4 [Candidatus Aenigmarchaeota archaeon]|nr:50S ribosomal protein L4 [Candidatus Aenigmarchaeota archaeon]
MKSKLYSLEGKSEKEIELPAVFGTPYRPDVIKRAVLAQQSNERQPYGADPLAGKKTSAHYHGSRHYRWSMMNKSMSRIPRIHGKVGYMHMRARFAPHAVKGRPAHPPKAEKIWSQKINAKEKILAIRSALAASANINAVKKRGHVAEHSPIIFSNNFEEIKKSKDVVSLFAKLFAKEMERCAVSKIRAGRGKMRGRRYTSKIGPLVIVSQNCSVIRSAKNIAGVDVVPYNKLNAELLAPGTHAGRLVVMSEAAMHKLGEKYGH